MHYRHRPPSLDEEDEESKEYRILKKIKTDIQYLIDLGFNEVLLKEVGDILFNEKEKTIQPSRLLIDDDFKIFLPDFDNLEIEMKPLPKALFFLFLRHPNGIHLKSLIDYRFELMDIYQMLSYRESLSTMNNSIDRLCSPIDGSINEKLSRIKEAFLKKTSIDAAMYYIVKGERGMKKNIELDRSLVSYPNSLMEIELTVIKDTLNK